MNNMRELLNLMESVVAVPGVGKQLSENNYDPYANYTVLTSTGKHVVYGPADKDAMQAHLARQYGGSGARIYGDVVSMEPYTGPVDTGRDDKSARSYWDEGVAVAGNGGDTESDMQTANTAAVNNGDAEFDAAQTPATESVPAVKSCQQSNPATADVACAMENNMSDYDTNFIASTIRNLYPMSTSEDELKRMVAGETGYGSNPEFDSMFSTELDKLLGREPEAFGQEFGGSQFEESATVNEAFDMQNGYNDVEVADGKDYFPNGADGPVVDAVGPSGARQGDNPEQKKMQVAETHKELVYAYRKFLKESAS